MPKQTFFNLPSEKRALIIEAAIEEFAVHGFQKASINKIVDKASIAKGSVYQYFENKEELYSYLVESASGKKLAYINKELETASDDFFQIYKRIIFLSARFDLEHTLYSCFLYSVGKDAHNLNMAKRIMSSSIDYVKQLLREAQNKGQIRSDVNLDLAAFLIGYLSVDVGEYIGQKYGFSYPDVLKSKAENLPVTDAQLHEVLDELVDFFKRGISLIH